MMKKIEKQLQAALDASKVLLRIVCAGIYLLAGFIELFARYLKEFLEPFVKS